MRRRKTIYICDHCGEIALEEKKYLFGGFIYVLPKDWTQLGKEHICPKCSEIYRRFKEEVYSEQQKSIVDDHHIEIKKCDGKLEVTKFDKYEENKKYETT